MRAAIILAIAFAFFVPNKLNAQIKGKVIDAKTGKAIEAATVQVFPEMIYSITDSNGNFLIDNKQQNEKLEVRFLGYNVYTLKLKTDNKSLITIQLEPQINALNEVIVSSSRYEQKTNEVPVSNSVVTNEVIRKYNINRADELVERIPGISVLNSQINIRGGGGFSFGVGSRAMILLDNLPLLGSYANDIRWHFIPMEIIEQAEVLKGPSSVLYGSSALNGVINFKTLWPSKKSETRISTFAHQFDVPPKEHVNIYGNDRPIGYGMSVYHLQKIGKVDVVAGVNLLHDDSYRLSDFSNRARLTFKTRYKPSEKFDIGFSTNFMQDSAGVFFIWKSDSLALRQRDDTIVSQVFKYYTIDPFVNWKITKNLKSITRGRLYYHTDRMHFLEHLFMQDFKIKKAEFKLSVGASYTKHQHYTKDTLFSTNLAYFSQLDLKYKKLFITAGIRLEEFNSNGVEKINYPVKRIALQYKLPKNLTWRASLGEGFRAPALIEKYVSVTSNGITILPNENLKAEQSTAYETGIRWEINRPKSKSFIDVAVFSQKYTSMIEFSYGLYPSGKKLVYGFKSENVSKAEINGIEWSFKNDIYLTKKSSLSFNGGYLYINPLDKRTEPNTTSSNTKYLKYRYHHLIRFEAAYTYSQFTISTFLKYNSAMLSVDNPWVKPIPFTTQYLVPGINEYIKRHNKGDFIPDIRVGYQSKFGLSVNAIVKNFTNTSFTTVPGSLGPYRQFILQLNMRI